MSDPLTEWWFTLQAWWQELTPAAQAFLRGLAVLLSAVLAGEVAARAGTAVYGVVLLLVLLIATDLFGWALTGSVVAAAWSLLLHAITAGTAMLIGWLGYRWARSLTLPESEAASSPARAAHYAAL